MIFKTLHKELMIERHEPNQRPGWTQVLQKGKQFLIHMWHTSCFSYYKPGDKFWMNTRNGIYPWSFVADIP